MDVCIQYCPGTPVVFKDSLHQGVVLRQVGDNLEVMDCTMHCGRAIALVNVGNLLDMKFYIGANVRSKLGGGFTGTVSGFEPNNGRIICVPKGKSAKNDRQRWAYLPEELELADTVSFKKNTSYTIDLLDHSSTYVNVIAVESPNSNRISLIRKNDGSLFAEVPTQVNVSDLSHYNIRKFWKI